MDDRLPGGALRLWFWMPVAALAVVSLTAGLLGWSQAWRDFWGVAIAVEVTAAAVGALAGVVFRRRPLGPGGAAAIGVAVTVVSFLLFGLVIFAGQQLLEAVGWFEPLESNPGELAGQALIFAALGLLFTWWYSLPAGAVGGLIAWSMARRRTAG